MRWYAFGKKVELGTQLAVLETHTVINPVEHHERLGDFLCEFDHEPSEEEKDLLIAKIDTPIIQEEPA